mgnify:CR=1 FL=1
MLVETLTEQQAFYRSYEWKQHRKQYLLTNKDHDCCMCGNTTKGSDTILDHIVGIRVGGAQFDEHNIQILCRSCNAKKRSKITMRTNYLDAAMIKL